MTSVMKAVVSLENRTILPNIKFHTPNPRSTWSLWGKAKQLAKLTFSSPMGCS
jgi:hypothetical protein